MDNAEPAIVRAQEIAAISPEWLAFKVGTMEALDFSPGSFDAVIAIESLYLCKDLASTIGQFNRLLRARSQMALFYTYIAEPGGQAFGDPCQAGCCAACQRYCF